MWAIHDRYIPIQEGWMQYYTLLTKNGLVPYKDFYFFTQPISLIIAQLISKFGDGYMLYRYYGMVERSLLILALYFLVSKHFSPAATFVAIVTSAFLYSSFNIDILYTYYQTTLLLFLLSLICLQFGMDSRRRWLFDCAAGFFASLAFFTKQSNGLFVSIFVLFIMVWYTSGEPLYLRVLRFLLGWIIPASIIFGWMIKQQIFSVYISQVFGGISAKGSILGMLFGFWVRHSAMQYFGMFVFGVLILYMLWIKKKLFICSESRLPSSLNFNKYLLLLIFPVYIVGGFLIRPENRVALAINTVGDAYLLLWLYFSFFSLTIASIFIGTKWIFRKKLPFSKPLSELILASFIWIYVTGFSGQLEIYATLLGTSIVLAFFLDRVQINWRPFKLLLLIGSCLVLFVCAAKKNQMPYAWWGWNEEGHSSSLPSIIPAFKGFILSPSTVEIYDKIYLDILENTTPNDRVYTYPFITLFNYVTNRIQPTFSPVHYFDVCPDYVAVMDAQKLIDDPPKMIIYMEMSPLVFKLHEDVFRNGLPSGQRKLVTAINKIVVEHNYQKIDSFISPGWYWPIYVWLKP